MLARPRIAALAALALGFGATGPLGAAEQAGVAAAVRGQVQIAERSGAVGRQARSGEPVFLGNAVASGPNAGMQIVLLDETTLTIGPNSQIVIDEFVYDPKTNAGKLTASVAKGVFRFVSGRISREQPGAMQVKLPVGTIGIRGTSGLGQVQDTGQETAILLGPGNDTDTNNRGGLDLSAGDTLVSLIRAGFGSTLLPGGNWGPPQKYDMATINQIVALLRGAWTGGPPVGGEPQPDRNAGRNLYDSRAALAALFGVYDLALFAQLIGEDGSQQENRDNTVRVNDGIALFEQLRTVNSGQAYWTQTGVPISLVPSGASSNSVYNLFLNIDFGKRAVGGGNSRVDIPAGGNFIAGSIPLASQSYAALSGSASLTFTNNTAYVDTGNCGNACRTMLAATIRNSAGVIGNTLSHTFTIATTAGQDVAKGSGTTGPRMPGLAP
ncbi:MAG: FecR family protein [Rhodospirillales bacterium]